MSVDKIVDKYKQVPESLKQFANWKPSQPVNTSYLAFTSCGSFCTGGACEVGLYDISMFMKKNYLK